jgi:alkylation response protein AidB-like acyl-CoA dehydrogenase
MPTATLEAAPPPALDMSLPPGLMSNVQAVIAEDLRPYVSDIDRKGFYPRPFMQKLGAIGGFGLGVPAQYGGLGFGVAGSIRVMEEVAKECLSTGFCVWCQTVCAWYIQNGESEYLKAEFLPKIATGHMLAGTGMSNPMKHFADIEKIRVNAVRKPGGFVLNGALPWVSNAGMDHCFAAVAYLPGEASYLMAIIPGDTPGMTHGDGGHFIALEGSSTCNAIFKDVFVPDSFVLAEPCKAYITRIRPGFVLTQTGFGLGLVESCVELMRRANARVGHVNCYLDDGVEEIEADLENTRRRVYALAREVGTGETEIGPEAAPEAVQCRIQTSELALRASQAAMLHAGAAGYRSGSTAERKLRESYFVAVVTPALKHLKKLQHDMAV